MYERSAMYSYSMIQWLFFFYFYCFFGWCFESTVVSVSKHKLVNRGFMRGPFLPLYGSGAIMMLVVSMPFQDNIILTYIAGCIGATILEYVTGVTMEALFKVRYWDYSNKRFNFQGHICLSSTLAWGFLTILMTEFVHKGVESLVLSIPNSWLTAVTIVLTAAICADFALAFKTALDLRDILVKMENAKAELVRVQKRLDVIIAVANEDIAIKREEYANIKEEMAGEWSNRMETIACDLNQRKEELTESIETKIEDLKNGIEEKLEWIRGLAQSWPSDFLESRREEIGDLHFNYKKNLEERDSLSRIKDFFQRDMIRSNPTMSSPKFKESLEELIQMNERKKKANAKDANSPDAINEDACSLKGKSTVTAVEEAKKTQAKLAATEVVEAEKAQDQTTSMEVKEAAGGEAIVADTESKGAKVADTDKQIHNKNE